VLEALPEPRHSLGVALLEVRHRVGDGPGEPERIDLPVTQAALLLELPDEIAAVDLLERANQVLALRPSLQPLC